MDFNLNSIVRPNILALKPYSSAREEFTGLADIYLDANENPNNTGLNRYPDPLQKGIKEKLAIIKQVKTNQIFLGNGSDEAIDLIIRIFCEPGQDEIITLPPTYGMYKVSAAISNVYNREILLQDNFQPDLEEIYRQISEKSKLLFICSPNNPTGNDIDQKAIESILKNFKGIVVIDEAYIDFSDRESSVKLLDKYPNLIVLQTFSKAWGLAGIRCGLAFSSPEIIELLNKVKPPYNLNILTQNLIEKTLTEENNLSKDLTNILIQRDLLSKELHDFSFVQKVYPSKANFLLAKVDDPIEIYQFLLKRKIIVRNRSTVPLCNGCLRFTVGTEKENFELIKALKSYEKSIVYR